ncbi:Cupin domain protein [Novipirellula galeiformis]|uniref:Cupin domain protein n=1 Tax=Novipirellula galeiformis TaxID=2528004 RepID=A0A5C6CE44_9BACT|nr:cupin domain-containing protein [Novipirellula galeiformis]TWU22037.1 Cupin domain protein [Novipirellula galeiformis]
MAIQHAKPGEVLEVGPLGDAIAATKTRALLKTESVEVLRLNLPAGKTIAEHKAPGEITVQCIEGRVTFTAMGQSHELTAGKLLYLSAAEPHAVQAQEDSSLLVTIIFGKQ